MKEKGKNIPNILTEVAIAEKIENKIRLLYFSLSIDSKKKYVEIITNVKKIISFVFWKLSPKILGVINKSITPNKAIVSVLKRLNKIL